LSVITEGSSVTELDSLSLVLSQLDIAVVSSGATTTLLDSISFSEDIKDISVETSSNIDLELLSFDLILDDISVDSITEVNIDSIDYIFASNNIDVFSVANISEDLNAISYNIDLGALSVSVPTVSNSITHISESIPYPNFYKNVLKQKEIKVKTDNRVVKKKRGKTYKELTGQNY
jgi:hypothetical protein